MQRRFTLAALLFCAVGCSSPKPAALVLEVDASAPAASATIDAEEGLPPVSMTGPIGGNRPVAVKTPAKYDAAAKHPLVVLLHGYGASGAIQDAYLGVSQEADRRGFVVAIPEGTKDASGKQYWNATDACCDFGGSKVDDVAYLRDVIRQIEARYAIDASQVYLIGHSNGAFLAHRFACEHARRVAGIAAIAGAVASDTQACTPARPVPVLAVHGTDDATIRYGGGALEQSGSPPRSVTYPGAVETVATWARRNGCSADAKGRGEVDVVAPEGVKDSKVTFYDACRPGGAAELWTIEGGSHIPPFTPGFLPAVFDFWAAHTLK